MSIFIDLIRVLFPNWSFFYQIAFQFELEFRISGSDTWRTISFFKTRRPLNIFVNEEANLALAQTNLLEHFAKDIQNIPDANLQAAQDLTTYKMVCSLLRVKIQELGLLTENIQFRLLARSPHESIEVYSSEWMSL